MSGRARFVVLVVVLCSVAAVMTAYAVGAAAGRQRRQAEAVAVTAATAERTDSIWAGPRIVFRHTGLDGGYGRVAAVALDDPAGPRSLSRVTCDRVAAVAGARGAVTSCLRIERAGPPAYTQTLYDGAWRPLQSVALPGIPSRTRLSPDGSLVAATTFVDHHDYEQVGFSTATVVRDVGGASLGNLESFALTIHGRRVAPRDRNVWGVTFADDRTFYATVAADDETYLVRGDLKARTLTSVADHVECPSLSPDGTRIGFKQATQRDGHVWWTPAVLELATGHRTVLTGEGRNVDDQVAWLDDDTLLYGVPRDDEPGVTDVWSLTTDPSAAPYLLVERAWSPTVVQ